MILFFWLTIYRNIEIVQVSVRSSIDRFIHMMHNVTKMKNSTEFPHLLINNKKIDLRKVQLPRKLI